MTILLNIFLYLLIGLMIVLGSILTKFMPKPRQEDYFISCVTVVIWPLFVIFIISESIKDRLGKK